MPPILIAENHQDQRGLQVKCPNHNIDAGGNCHACGYNTDQAIADAVSRGEDPYGFVPDVEMTDEELAELRAWEEGES